MNSQVIRHHSAATLARAGLAVPAHLPLLDISEPKSERETLKRLACLYACSASAYGFSKEKALAWVEAEGLIPWLEEEEALFLRGNELGLRFRFQVEGILALAWALGAEEELDWFEAVDDGFVHRLPDLKTGEPLSKFGPRVKMRAAEEIAQGADLAYCLHWAWRDAAMRGAGHELPIDEHVIVERRRALEWLTDNEPWYEITLDT